MKLLALECSATAASVALVQGHGVIGEYFLRSGQTHSQTLLPMVQNLLTTAGETLGNLDGLAVSVGPGSFTGLRIGIAAVKGMALGANKLCAGVSTLEALAWNLRGYEGVAVAVMDARCQQVYTALFALKEGHIIRLTPDTALAITDLEQLLQKDKGPLWLVGDGAELCYQLLAVNLPGLRLAPAHLLLQRASSVGAVAQEIFASGKGVDCAQLNPIYLRLSQAERELQKKQKEETKL